MPRDSRNSRNSSKTSSGFSRSATVVTGAEVRGAPGAREVPVAEVPEEGDDRAAAVDDLAHRAVAHDPHPVEEVVGGETGRRNASQ